MSADKQYQDAVASLIGLAKANIVLATGAHHLGDVQLRMLLQTAAAIKQLEAPNVVVDEVKVDTVHEFLTRYVNGYFTP